MHDNFLSELRTARARAVTLTLCERRHLVRRILEQLAELRDAGRSNRDLRTNQHLARLINSGDNSVADLPKLSDQEFCRMLGEFELLLNTLTDIVKIDGRAVLMN
ncbi:conserved hypothetical protein [Agrobacterium tumefaciens str. Kerr 14]|uniref:Uncharacterized protein n=1 Tax=Agrobacterium tumefaciens str. Kerr 14 TaxID=1183424 RepID=A0A1S7SFJ0_AGRTU|nr:hypothetical protein [Agrobacterium tumefaciens]CUX68042.1 conserved hypothetical protein [Agrobacterium tumefaciens str. Kerr 14]